MNQTIQDDLGGGGFLNILSVEEEAKEEDEEGEGEDDSSGSPEARFDFYDDL